jgi:hypothetical protein
MVRERGSRFRGIRTRTNTKPFEATKKTMQRVKRVREFKREDDGLGVGKRGALNKQ